MVKIYYRGADVFDGICPTPLVGVGEDMLRGTGLLGAEKSISLEGQITGCIGASGLYGKYLTLIGKFSKNFGELSIVEEADTAYAGELISEMLVGSTSVLKVSDSSDYSSYNKVLLGGFSGIPSAIYDIESLPTATGVEISYSGAASYLTNLDGFLVGQPDNAQLVLGARVSLDSSSIPNNKFFGIVPFSMEFTRYDGVDDFASYGLKDASEEFSFQDNEDCSYSLTHTIFAKGSFGDPHQSPLANAKAYCTMKSGWNSQVLPIFIPEPDDVALISIEENVNRLAGEVSLVENYLFSDSVNTSGYPAVMKYTVDGQDSDEELNVSIQGSINFGLHESAANMRAILTNMDWYSIASGHADIFGKSLTNKEVARSIKENNTNKQIDFSYTYSDNPDTGNIRYSEWITVQESANSRNCVTVRGRIERNSYRCNGDVWNDILAYYSGLNPYSIASGAWGDEGFTGVMSTHPRQISFSENKQRGALEFSRTFCEENFGEDECIRDLDYRLSFKPSLTKYSAEPLLYGSGEYIIQNLGYKNRGSYSIDGSATISDCCTQQEAKNRVRAMLDELSNKFFVGTDKILDSQNITTDGGGRSVSFQAAWSMNSGVSIPTGLL